MWPAWEEAHQESRHISADPLLIVKLKILALAAMLEETQGNSENIPSRISKPNDSQIGLQLLVLGSRNGCIERARLMRGRRPEHSRLHGA